jgi:small subunit ribosomal protein S4e
MPLTLVLRDILGVAKTRSEAKAVVHDGKIMVDGKVQREDLFPTGLMDVISMPEVEKWYRVLPHEKGLFFHPISKDEATLKLCRIENKTTLSKGNAQLNLHDGRNLYISVKDPNKREEDVFDTWDTVKISLPNQEILGHLKLAEGASALIVGGKNIGKHGRIVAVEQRQKQKRKNLLVTVEDEKGSRFQTTMEYVFVVGDTKPHISLPEAS